MIFLALKKQSQQTKILLLNNIKSIKKYFSLIYHKFRKAKCFFIEAIGQPKHVFFVCFTCSIISQQQICKGQTCRKQVQNQLQKLSNERLNNFQVQFLLKALTYSKYIAKNVSQNIIAEKKLQLAPINSKIQDFLSKYCQSSIKQDKAVLIEGNLSNSPNSKNLPNFILLNQESNEIYYFQQNKRYVCSLTKESFLKELEKYMCNSYGRQNINKIENKMSNQWCKFDSIDHDSYIINASMFSAQCVLLILYCKSAHEGNKLHVGECKAQKLIQMAMLLWFVVSFVKAIINMVTYPVFMVPNNPHKAEIILSAICLFCDRMSSFLIHTILLRIPCVWIRNTICKLENNSDLSLLDRKRIDRAFSVVRVMTLYCKCRLVIVLINFAFATTMCFYTHLGSYSKYLTVITQFECALSICIYTFGIHTMFQFRYKLPIPQKIYTRLAIQYIILLICCCARLVFNTLQYFIRFSTTYQPNEVCLDTNTEFKLGRYTYISVGFLLMHLLPVSFLLLIYWPEQADTWKSSRNILLEGCLIVRFKANTDSSDTYQSLP